MENNITVNMENLSVDEREQLMKLIEKASKVENKAWKPEDGEQYYFIDSVGRIGDCPYNSGNKSDNSSYEIGNCFKTKEEAEFAVEKLKVIAEMKRVAAKDGEVEWDGEIYHRLVCDHENNNILINNGFWHRYQIQGAIYFASKERAQEAIDTIGEDRIKKYLFGMEDEYE